MKKWLTIGVLVLLGLWGPFVYSELTSSRVESKASIPGAADDDGPSEEEIAVAVAAAEAAEELAAEEAAAAEAEQAQAELPPDEPLEEEEVQQEEEIAEELVAEGEEGPKGEFVVPADEPVRPIPSGGPLHATELLKKTFDNEPRDARWASDTERDLIDIFANSEVPDSALEAARCQKTVCRLELVWTQEDSEAWLEAYKGVRAAYGDEVGLQPLTKGAPEGEQRIHMYIPRKGYTLADLQE